MTSEELEDKYYHLFKIDEHGLIWRGIEVNNGWIEIVNELLFRIDLIYKKFSVDMNSKKVSPISILQIKQKFGKLIVYYDIHPNFTALQSDIDILVNTAETQAKYTCEICGRVGSKDGTIPVITREWLLVLCSDCDANRYNDSMQLSFNF